MRSTSTGLLAVQTPHQAERLGSSLAGTTARPLARLAQELAQQAGAPRVASRAEVWVATRRALEHLGALPGPEATAERRAATVAAFDAAIGWLHRTGADPAAWSASDRPRAQVVARAAELVAAALRSADRVDARSLPAIAARGAASLAAGATPRVDVVGIVPGAIDAVLAIEALHAAARRAGGGARLVLPRPRPDPGGDEPLADWIERRWSAHHDAPELVWIPALAPEPSAVERIEAPTPRAEAREIAAAVAAAIAAGTAPEQVAVVVPRGDDPVVRPLLDALADAGIPASREGGEPVLDAPEVAVALDLLAMADGRLTRDGLADVLRAPGLHAGSWTGAAHEDEAARVATQVAHRLREVPVAVDRSGGARLVESLALTDPLASAVVARAVASLRAIGAARGREAVVGEWSALVGRLRLGRPSAAEIGAALRGELAPSDTASRTAAARLGAIAAGARAVGAVLDAARALVDAEKRLGIVAPGLAPGDVLAEVRELVRTATSAAGGGAPRAGSVRVATARDLAGLTHALVVVAGLGATAYGASEVRGLVDEESLLELPLDRRPPPIAARRAARALELEWTIAGATRVVLTRRAGLAGGHDEAPHPLFASAGGVGDDAAAPRRAPASALLPGARLASSRDAMLARLAVGDRVDAPSTALAAERAEHERSRFFLDPRQPAGRFSGRLSSHRGVDVASRLGGDVPERPVPVTAIERAARCPFAAFASRVLRTRRVDDAVEAATARERGLLVHEALEHAFVALRGAPPSAPLAARRAIAEAAALARAAPDQATPLRREAILAAVRDALAVVDLDLESGDAGAFRLAEQRFGAGQPAPWGPLRLDPPAGSAEPPVWVDGQIDRLDAATDGRWVRVVDYKTGKLPPKKDEHVRSLQLALYADAARRAGSPAGDPGDDRRATPVEVAARYVEVKRGAARTRDVTVDDEALDAARSSTRRVVLRLWSGDVAPRTIDPRMCRRCDARDVCRKPAVAALDDEAETSEEPGPR